jgi:Ni,Fe-hydrogenase III small subunit
MADKLKLGLYWAASCGGCEIAIVELREKILVVDEVADILFWPCAMDFKEKDVVAMPDGHMDVCLFNGAIRTSENEHMAHLLRKKSKVLVAFGSCAHEGCIPGLANLFDRQSIFERVYKTSESVENPEGIVPQTSYQMPEGEITIPHFYDTVKTLDQVEDVDYYVPDRDNPERQPAAQRQRGGGQPEQDGVRRVQAQPYGEAHQEILPPARDHSRSRFMPLRSRHHLCGAGDAGWLWRAVHQR